MPIILVGLIKMLSKCPAPFRLISLSAYIGTVQYDCLMADDDLVVLFSAHVQQHRPSDEAQ